MQPETDPVGLSISGKSAQFNMAASGIDVNTLAGMVYRARISGARHFTFVNNYCRSVLGYSAAELTRPGAPGMDELIAEDDKQLLASEMARARLTGAAYSVVYRLKHKAGFFVQVHERGSFILEESGEAVETQGFIAPTGATHFISEYIPQGSHHGEQRLINYRLVVSPDGSESFAYIKGDVRELFGCSEADLMRDSSLRFNHIHPEDEHLTRDLVNASNARGIPLMVEYRLLHRGERDPIWIRGTGLAHRMPDGTVIRTGTAIDISDIKKAEMGVVQAKNLLESIQQATGMLLTVSAATEDVLPNVLRILSTGMETDAAYICQWAKTHENEAGKLKCIALWNYLDGICISPNAQDEEKQSYYLKHYHPILSEGKEIACNDTRLLHAELSPGLQATLAVPIFINQKYWGYIAFEEFKFQREWTDNELRTIRSLAHALGNYFENRQYRARLEEQFTRLKATLGSTLDGIMLVNQNGCIMESNDRLLSLWQLKTNPVGRHARHFVREVLNKVIDGQAYLRQMRHTFSQQYDKKLNYLSLQDGRIIERYSSPLITEGGFHGWVLSYRDVTEREAYEKKLRIKAAQLEKTSRELDRFVYSASHELRAPLLSVIGLLNLAERDDKESALLEYHSRMRESIGRLDELVQNIIHHSQYRRHTLQVELLNVPALAEENFRHLKYHPNFERLRFTHEVNVENDIYSDPVAIGIVINNLLSNAIKFQDFSKADNYIHFSAKDNPGGGLAITISDSGEGIDKKFHGNLFSMFYRASHNRSGSGLGLYIVKELVETLKGYITVQSDEGSGSTFTVILPNLTDLA